MLAGSERNQQEAMSNQEPKCPLCSGATLLVDKSKLDEMDTIRVGTGLNMARAGVTCTALVALRIRSLIADKEMIIASANRDITQYGEWRTDYNAWHAQTDRELQSLFSEANTSVSGPCPPDAAQLQHQLSDG